MKLYSQLISLGIVAALHSGCGEKFDDSLSSPFSAYVLTLANVQDDGSTEYGIEKKTFDLLTDFNSLSSPYIDIIRGGSLKVKSIRGSIVSADSFSGGGSPKLRYVVKDGAAVARDYTTLAQISAAYQFDQIFARFEDTLGINLADFQGALPQKIRAYFEPDISVKDDDGDLNQTVKLNAAYLPGQHQFVLFQRSAVENVPLSSNIQVLAHEFGHSLFDFAFFKNKKDDKRHLDNEYSISGINEGFADFISYLYTNSADVLGASFDDPAVSNQRHFLKISFNYNHLLIGSKCSGSFYCIGTLFAKSLVTAMLRDKIEKKVFAAQIIGALQNSLATMHTYSTSLLPKYEGASANYLRIGHDSAVLSAFLRALLENLPTATRSSLCKEFATNYGVIGFNETARTEVCTE